MALHILTQQLGDASVTAAKIATLSSKISYTATHALTSETDIVHKKYVDDIAVYGVSWKSPVSVFKMTSDSNGNGSPPSNPQIGQAFVVNNWSNIQSYNDGVITASTKNFYSQGATFSSDHVGTYIVISSGANKGSHLITAFVDSHNVTLGNSTLYDQNLIPFRHSAFEDGAIVEYTVVSGEGVWVTIVPSSEMAPPDGTRVLVGTSNLSGSFSGEATCFAVYSASTNSWTFSTPEDGDAVLVNGNGSIYANSAFVYESASGDAYWAQIAGPGTYTAGDGISISGNQISAKADTEKGIYVSTTGIQVRLASGMYEYSGLEFSSHPMETGALNVKAGDGITITSSGVTLRTVGTPGISVSADAGVFVNAKIPVSVMRAFDTASSEPSNPPSGKTYLATNSGTWGGVQVNPGDFMLYTGNSWIKQVPGQNGKAAYGTRLVVDPSAPTNGAFGSFRNYVMTVTLESNNPLDWDAYYPEDGTAVVITTSHGRGTQYYWNSTEWTIYPSLQTSSGLENSETYGGLKVALEGAGGLEISSNGMLQIKVSDSSLTLASEGINVNLNPAGGLMTVSNLGLSVNWKLEEKTNWDGNNPTWVLTRKAVNYPIITINGVVARRVESNPGANEYTYTQSSSTIMFGSPPASGSITTAYYFDAGSI